MKRAKGKWNISRRENSICKCSKCLPVCRKEIYQKKPEWNLGRRICNHRGTPWMAYGAYQPILTSSGFGHFEYDQCNWSFPHWKPKLLKAILRPFPFYFPFWLLGMDSRRLHRTDNIQRVPVPSPQPEIRVLAN